jgi:hypothetical protein
MLLLNPYTWLAGALVVGGLWAGHTYRVSSAEKAGYARAAGECKAKDDIALAVGKGKTELLARSAIRQTEVFIGKLQTLEARNTARSLERAKLNLTVDELRIQLDASSTQTGGEPTAPACRGDDIKLRSCEAMVSSGLTLAQGARGLVDEAEDVLTRSDAALTALQAWSLLVRSANEAP